MFEGLVGVCADPFVIEINLNPARGILQGGKAGLALYTLEHHPAGNGHLYMFGLKLLSAVLLIALMQCRCPVGRPNIVGKGSRAGPEGFELGPTLGHDLMFIKAGLLKQLVAIGRWSRFAHLRLPVLGLLQ